MKDQLAFAEKQGVCYIPQSEDRSYTYQDYLRIANGNEQYAHILFSLSEWQYPETIKDEDIREGFINAHCTILPPY